MKEQIASLKELNNNLLGYTKIATWRNTCLNPDGSDGPNILQNRDPFFNTSFPGDVILGQPSSNAHTPVPRNAENLDLSPRTYDLAIDPLLQIQPAAFSPDLLNQPRMFDRRHASGPDPGTDSGMGFGNKVDTASSIGSRVVTPVSMDMESEGIGRKRKVNKTMPSPPWMHSASRTALQQAVANGHISVVRLLVTHGADVNAQDEEGQTPLHECARNGDAAVTKLLMEKGAQLEVRDDKGLTPLQVAAALGKAAVVEVLLQNGADINARLHNDNRNQS